MKKRILFYDYEDIIQIHKINGYEFGIKQGLRDLKALENMCDGARNVAEELDREMRLYKIAAFYACRVKESEPFNHGNARTALLVAIFFLYINGIDLKSDPKIAEAVVGGEGKAIDPLEFEQVLRHASQSS